MKNDLILWRLCAWSAGLFSFLLLSVGANAQGSNNPGDNPSFTKTIPPPPTAASLGKYGDVPVSYYTGIPNINIPLYEVKNGDISVPISLGYHAGGIRVEEIASWVGLGWSLNAGGVITRTVRGIADEKDLLGKTYKENIDEYRTAIANQDQDREQEILSDITNGKIDTEPDLFHFNFLGISGKFFIGEDGTTVHTIPQRRFKISFNTNGSGGSTGHILTWTITDMAGVVYTFGKSSSNDGIEYNNTYSVCGQLQGDGQSISTEIPLASTWYLTEIRSPKGDIVTFQYDGYSYNYRNLGNQTDYNNIPSDNSTYAECQSRTTFCYTRNQVKGKKLRKINFLNGSVEFSTKNRYDICGEQALEHIKVFRKEGVSPVKTFSFDYSYFVGLGRWAQPTSCGEERDGGFYRLKLNSVLETGSNNEKKNPYLFSYDETYPMPPRFRESATDPADSYAQDHWGYYNGKTNNRNGWGRPTLIPTSYLGTVKNEGADRSSDEKYAKAYVLTKVNYPTGGETIYEYESNKISYNEEDDVGEELLVPMEERFDFHKSTTNADAGTEYYSIFFVVSDERFGSVQAQVDLWSGGNNYDGNDDRDATEVGPNDDCASNSHPMYREILREDGSVIFGNGSLGDGAYVTLPNGTYRIRLTRKNSAGCNYSNYSMGLKWTQYQKSTSEEELNQLQVGGLRIKKITDYDGMDQNNDKVRIFHYNSFEEVTKSSGTLVSRPNYGWMPYSEWHRKDNGTAPVTEFRECTFQIRQSYTHIPLATTQGAFVGYKNVEVWYGTKADNGKTRYIFTSPREYGDNTNTSKKFPFPPATSRELKRGLLLSEEVFANRDDEFVAVRTKTQDYNMSSGLVVQAGGLKVGVKTKGIGQDLYEVASYPTNTDWVPLEREETVTHTPVTGTLVEKKSYEYSLGNLLVSKEVSYNSAGEQVIQRYKYPLDITGQSSLDGGDLSENEYSSINNLKSNHQIALPIQQEMWKNGVKLSTQRTTYKDWGSSGPVLPELVKTSKENARLENRIRYHGYDQAGNPVMVSKEGGAVTSYFWGHNRQYPIAKIENATYSEIASVLGTTESGLKGFSEVNLSEINSLRDKLPNAIITTYTYAPLIGMTSMTDPNGITTYYEYDGFGRLQRIRDHENNILKEYEYNYKKPED